MNIEHRISATAGWVATALLLAALSGLYIYTEWHTGTDDTQVDNIVLTAPPDLAPPVVNIGLGEEGLIRLCWDPVVDPPATGYLIQRRELWPSPLFQTVAVTADTCWTDPEEPSTGAAL